MDDGLQDPPLLGIGEDNGAHRRSVQLPLVGEHLRSERLDHLLQPVGAGRDRLARQDVGIDHHGAQLVEDGRDSALAGGDATGQADPHHGLPANSLVLPSSAARTARAMWSRSVVGSGAKSSVSTPAL